MAEASTAERRRTIRKAKNREVPPRVVVVDGTKMLFVDGRVFQKKQVEAVVARLQERIDTEADLLADLLADLSLARLSPAGKKLIGGHIDSLVVRSAKKSKDRDRVAAFVDQIEDDPEGLVRDRPPRIPAADSPQG